jgi:anti-sigma regulatory factor (Ser/Thr protein kinase)
VTSQSTDYDVELELPVAPESVALARNSVAGLVSLARESDVALGVSEAVSNAVVHAFRGRDPGTISLRARHDGERLVIAVSDDGGGIRPTLEGRGLGVGMGLIREVTNELRIESSDRGTTVWMEFEGARRR